VTGQAFLFSFAFLAEWKFYAPLWPSCLPLSVFPVRACMIKHRAIAEKWTGHKHTDTPLFGLCHIIYLMVRAQQK
jgi:hypothetical protein